MPIRATQSQTVLLRGINDDAAVLEALFRGLVAMRVKPYYLHYPDLARGTAHFRPGIASGQRLVLYAGYSGGYGKVPITPNAIRADEHGDGWIVEDSAGVEHTYPPDS